MGLCQRYRPDRCFLVYTHRHHSHDTVVTGALDHPGNIFAIGRIIKMAVAVEYLHFVGLYQ
jgi:zona occludens toxin (predicted ATPase)